MELIATLAGGPPLSWALGATDRHGAPRAAHLAHRDAPTVTQCPCGVVAHPDALEAMGHAACARMTAPCVRLACDCGATFSTGPALMKHTTTIHGRDAAKHERTPQ